jgi:oligoribonuclease
MSLSKIENIEKLAWLDMEMTGLNPLTDSILEIALVITNTELKVLDLLHIDVQTDSQVLKGMDEWCTKTHSESGLMERCLASQTSIKMADEACGSLLRTHFPEKRAILAGNSIHQDRKFVDIHMPLLERQLHYRMLDVSTFKVTFQMLRNTQYHKKDKHSALEDIFESIEEYSYYLKECHLMPPGAAHSNVGDSK